MRNRHELVRLGIDHLFEMKDELPNRFVSRQFGLINQREMFGKFTENIRVPCMIGIR